MRYNKFWIFFICLGLLFTLGSTTFAQDMTSRDLDGISPQHYKYIITTAGGAAVGAGLGFILGGGAKTGKLALIGGGGASAWFLHTHRSTLGKFHDWAMVASGTALGTGIGWTICNCDNGLVAGTLLGGGGTAVWEALKNDSAAHNALKKSTDKTSQHAKKADRKAEERASDSRRQ